MGKERDEKGGEGRGVREFEWLLRLSVIDVITASSNMHAKKCNTMT